MSENRHNHITRDIKAPGKCPACDATHAEVVAFVDPAVLPEFLDQVADDLRRLR